MRNNWDDRKSHKLDQEERDFIFEMTEDFITPRNIARYMGYSTSTVLNILNPGKRKEIQMKWNQKNRARVKRSVDLYQKKYKKRVNKRCIDCNKLISVVSTRCMSCASSERSKKMWKKRKLLK